MSDKARLLSVDVAARRADCVVVATNDLGTRSIGIAFFVQEDHVLERLAGLQAGAEIRVDSAPSVMGAPCAMTMLDFSDIK